MLWVLQQFEWEMCVDVINEWIDGVQKTKFINVSTAEWNNIWILNSIIRHLNWQIDSLSSKFLGSTMMCCAFDFVFFLFLLNCWVSGKTNLIFICKAKFQLNSDFQIIILFKISTIFHRWFVEKKRNKISEYFIHYIISTHHSLRIDLKKKY